MERSREAVVVERINKKRMSVPPSSACNIPPEIWVKILSRIPVRPLLRLRAVCKLFRYLVPSDPLLVDLHPHHHGDISTRRVMVLEEWTSWLASSLHSTALQVPCRPENSNAAPSLVFDSFVSMDVCYTRMIQPCRGVVGAFGEDLAILCNPATGEWVCFSKPSGKTKEILHIGWDTRNGVFKVVRMCILKEIAYYHLHESYLPPGRVPVSLTCEICTLDKAEDSGDDSNNNNRRYNNHLRPCWTWLADSTNPLLHISKECFHGDGILCWGVMALQSPRGFTSILSLDLTTQEFETTPLPELFHSPSAYATFQELDGRMCIIFWPLESEGPIDIWMLKDINAVADKDSWYLRCSIPKQGPCIGRWVKLLAMWDNGIIYTGYEEKRKSMFYYDLRLQKPTRIPWSFKYGASGHRSSRFPSSNNSELFSIDEISLAPSATFLSSVVICVYEETLAPIMTRRESQKLRSTWTREPNFLCHNSGGISMASRPDEAQKRFHYSYCRPSRS